MKPCAIPTDSAPEREQAAGVISNTISEIFINGDDEAETEALYGKVCQNLDSTSRDLLCQALLSTMGDAKENVTSEQIVEERYRNRRIDSSKKAKLDKRHLYPLAAVHHSSYTAESHGSKVKKPSIADIHRLQRRAQQKKINDQIENANAYVAGIYK